MDGYSLILKERQRQIQELGFDSRRDAAIYPPGALAKAAKCYELAHNSHDPMPTDWPWYARLWRPNNNPIRNFMKAGALYLAEAERAEWACDTGGWEAQSFYGRTEAKRMAEAIDVLQKVTLCDLTKA